MALHEACMGVQVHTGTRIHWGAPQTFFLYESQGEGGGGSPSKFFGNTDLKKFRKLRTTLKRKVKKKINISWSLFPVSVL